MVSILYFIFLQFEAKKLEKPGPIGLQGVDGVNGSDGAQGARGPGPNFKECTYVTKPESKTLGSGESLPNQLLVDSTFQNVRYLFFFRVLILIC